MRGWERPTAADGAVALAAAALDGLPDRVAVLDPTGRIVAVNRAWREVALACGAPLSATCEGADYLGACDAATGGPDEDIAREVSTALRDIARGARDEFVTEYPCHDPQRAEESWFELRASVLLHAGARFVTVVHADRTRRVVAERARSRANRIAQRLRRLARALQDSEERLRRAEAAAGVVAFEIEPGGTLRGPQDALRRLLGLPPQGDLLLGDLLAALRPEDRRRVAPALDQLREAGGSLEEEVRMRLPGGATRWLALRGAADASEGRPCRFLGALLDVTERRAAEERRELLAREVDHRAKNVLAVVQAVIAFSLPEDAAGPAEALKGRVAALARAHALLSASGWEGAGLQALIEGELAPYRGATGPAVVLDGPPLALSSVAAQPMSMILHELATNAAKHGALSRPEGRLEVTWRTPDARFVLLWREAGGPPLAAPPGQHGFGSRLVTSVVRRQLGGSLALEWRAEGLRVTLSAPLARIIAAAGDAPSAADPHAAG